MADQDITAVAAEKDPGSSDLPKTVTIDSAKSLPVADQSNSRLMQIPSEIRLMILREVLHSQMPVAQRQVYEVNKMNLRSKPVEIPEVLQKRTRVSLPRNAKNLEAAEMPESKKKRAKKVLGYRLSPHILRTCQSLLREGWPLLYGENTVVLNAYPDPSYDNYRSISFGAHFTIPAFRSDPAASNGGGFWIFGDDAKRFVMKFSKVQIELHFQRGIIWYDGLRRLVTELGQVVSGSTVLVRFVGQADFSDGDVLRCFRAFQLVRCKSFKVLDAPDALSSAIKSITETITSDTSVIDLWPSLAKMNRLRGYLYLNTKVTNTYQFVFDMWRELEEAARNFDTERFCQVKGQLVNMVDQEIAEMKQDLHGGVLGLTCV